MFSSSKNIENLSQLFSELKKYAELQKEYVLLDIVRKAVRLLAAIVLGMTLFVLGMVALFYLSFAVAAVLTKALGSEAMSYAVITVFFVFLFLLTCYRRKAWIVEPLTRFVIRLFMEQEESNAEEDEEPNAEEDED